MLFGSSQKEKQHKVRDGEEIFDKGLFALFDDWGWGDGGDEDDGDVEKQDGKPSSSSSSAAHAVGKSSGVSNHLSSTATGMGIRRQGIPSSSNTPIPTNDNNSNNNSSNNNNNNNSSSSVNIPSFRGKAQVAPWERKHDDSVGDMSTGEYFEEKNRVEDESEIRDSRYPHPHPHPHPHSTEFNTSYHTEPINTTYSTDPFAVDYYPPSDAESESMASSTMASDAGLRVVDKIDITGNVG